MRTKMETAEREDKLLTDMLDIIRFTEGVSAKLHRVTDEAKIYQVVKDEFAKSDHYTASILLLADDGASLRLAETSIAPSRLEVLEKASGLRAKGYKINLSKSGIYTQVVREGKTVQANVSDIIREFLPRPVAYLISKTMGYDKQSSILTPLHKQGKVIGVLAMSCTDLCEYFAHSVENLALHISTALELAHKHTQRQRALQALKRYHDHLGELVEERTGELKKVNEKLREEVTERKRAEEALRTEKNKLQSVIGAMEYGLTIQDRDYNIIYQNELLRSTFGVHPGEKCYRVYEGKDKLCDGCPVEKAFRDGKSHTAERRVVLPSGEDTFWENTANPIRDAGGRIVSCLEIARNITERKRAEEALQTEKNKLQSLIDTMEYGLAIQDTDHNLLYMKEPVGTPSGGRVGDKCYRAFEGRDKACDGCPVDKAFRDGKSHTAERRVVTPSGEVTFWENTANPIRDAGGRVVSCLEIARNITERKRMEQELHQAEEQFRVLVEESPLGLSMVTKDGRYQYVNPKFVKMFGYTLKDIPTGQEWVTKAYPDPEYRKQVISTWNIDLKASERGKADQRTFTVTCKDGSEKVIFFRSVTLRTGDHLLIYEDITERKQAEEALRESEERFRSIVENSQVGIMILDDAYRFLYVNDEVLQISGYSREETIGQDFRQFLDEESRQLVADRYIRRQRGEEVPPRYEFNIVRKDGQKRRVEISSAVIRDSAGAVKTVAQILDVTERKQAEEELKLRAQILDSATDSIFLHDFDGNFIYVNEATCRTHGYSREELMKMKLHQVIAPERVSRLASDFQEMVGKGQVIFESAHLRKDGSIMPAEVHGRTIESGGRKLLLTVIRDITERKRAEEALQAEKNKLQSVINAMEDGLTIQDKDYNIIYQNEPQRVTFGDHVGEKCYRVYEGNEKVCDGCPVEKAFRDGKSHTSERRSVLPSGEVTFWENTANPIRDAGGRIVSCLEITRNITERRQAEEALSLQQAYFQQLFDNSPDAIALLDKTSRVVQVNKGFETLFGYRTEEVEGQRIFDAVVPEDRIKETKALTQAVLSGKAVRKETVRRRKGGSLVDVSLLRYPIRLDSETIGTYVIYTDITKRKQAEEALRESQKFSSSLLESSPNPVAVVNVDTSIRYANPAFEKLTGFTSTEIVGKKAPYPWWPEGKRERILAAFKDAIEHGGRRTERNFQNKNGERFWVTLSSAPVMQDGKPIYLIISWLDITERKQAEEKEKQLQQELYLAQRLAAVGELAAGVAHEINNPLTGVLGFSQRLMRKSTDKEVSRDLEIIHDEARRAADVVQNLLTFARRRQPKKEYTNINDIVQRTLELRSYALQTSNIEVITALAHSLPEAMVDFPQMQEVFLNIILNAEQAMSEAHGRGKLAIKTRRVKDHVRISFADDGPGISPENLVKVFDPFFTTREQKGGTGLGLSACHGIVTEHGGRIYVRSKLGEGATFIVELPLSPVETTVASQS